MDASTGLLTLKGRVENRQGTLRDGMYVSISLPTESLEDALLVDYASVGSDGLGEFLYTVDEQGCVQKSHIRSAGLWADSLLIVTAGLKPGTRYVKDALMSVRVGERVEGTSSLINN